MKSLTDRILEHLDGAHETEYEVVLAVNFEIHKWLKEQEEETAKALLFKTLRGRDPEEQDAEIAADLLKWIYGPSREEV